MRNLSLLFLFFLIYNQVYPVLTISPEKDQESIAKAKEANNVAQIFIKTVEGYTKCTATLISPNIMITAAHCVQDTDYTLTDKPFQMQGFASFYADTNDAFEAHFNKTLNSFIPIDAAIIHPDRDLNMKDSSVDDVAFIRLTENQDRPVFELYKEDLKSQIEVLLNPKSIKNYDVDSFLMNCYGHGFGNNVFFDSKRRYFIAPVQMIEQKEDWFHDFYLQSIFFGPFPNDKTSEFEKCYNLEERANFNERLIEKNRNALDAFPSIGDSGSALLFNSYIIGVYSYGFPTNSMESGQDFQSVLSFHGVATANFAPLFDMDGKPIEKIYNLIPQLVSFEAIEQAKTAEDFINEWMRRDFTNLAQALKQTLFSDFFLECAECKTYDIDAWKFNEFVVNVFPNLNLRPLIDANNSYALRLRDMLADKVNP